MKTGFIGLGAMGRGMAANLNKGGFLTCAWNRTRASVAAYAGEQGIRLVDTPADVAAETELVVTCVSADTDLREVIDALVPGLRAESVVVDCSTVSADTARRVANMTTAAGASFLDAPVSGGVEGARNGTLAMMVGGDAAVLERVRPALQSMAGRVVHMGPVGSGQATKAANQIMGAGINQAVTEALAFGAAQGLDLGKVIEVVSQGAAGNWFLEHRGPTMIQGQFAPGFKVALHRKDLNICKTMAQELGVALSVVEQTLGDYQRLIDQGHGDEDISALYRIKKALFGTDG
jgi:3-hydroxyisobutyrate dehydrogenase